MEVATARALAHPLRRRSASSELIGAVGTVKGLDERQIADGQPIDLSRQLAELGWRKAPRPKPWRRLVDAAGERLQGGGRGEHGLDSHKLGAREETSKLALAELNL